MDATDVTGPFPAFMQLAANAGFAANDDCPRPIVAVFGMFERCTVWARAFFTGAK